jgi:hypothetical protein
VKPTDIVPICSVFLSEATVNQKKKTDHIGVLLYRELGAEDMGRRYLVTCPFCLRSGSCAKSEYILLYFS